MDRSELISIRLKLVKRDIPSSKNITLVAVSKKYPYEDVKFAHQAGQIDFGENRIDELVEKSECAANDHLHLRWHFIGNLQSNKISKLFNVKNLKFIHSVDSFSLLEKLYGKSNILQEKVGFYLQVKTSNEKEKGGFDSYDDLAKTINLILKNQASNLKMVGLMTMSKVRTENFEEDARACFQKLKKIRKQLQQDFGLGDLSLSMGMSNDLEIAVEEGTDCVRVGSAIFRPE
ncbi:MAG: YggS family pyridoxal phosphate-dependent enzyme [Oligoflexia bacterium]|nr:YggS family pyridoxal phosphate-dependent enzyme [Oligoflexia bacterium]